MVVKLRYHHLYNLVQEITRTKWQPDHVTYYQDYTREEAEHFGKQVRWLLSQPEDTVIKIVSGIEGFICAGCTVKDDPERDGEACFRADKTATETGLKKSFQEIMGFEMGKKYPLGEILEKAREFRRMEKAATA